MTRPTLLLTAVLLLVALGAGASEQSERAYSRGLLQFHSGHYAGALRLFDDAVRNDPQDAYALYYRGVTYARLADFANATKDLRSVTTMRPDLDQAALELGVVLVEAEHPAEAVPWLERAQRLPEDDARASLFLGIAELRLHRLAEARENFRRAAARDPQLRVPALYHQAVAEYEQGDSPAAQEHFAAVTAAAPHTEVGRAAAAFLDKLRGTAGRRFEIYGAVGLQYDSNVVLAPSNETIKSSLGVSKQADGRATLDAGATYVPWRNEHAQLQLGYELYQSLHFDLSDFDLQDHRPSAQVVVTTDWLRAGLLGRYDFYLLRDNAFLQEATALPWVEIPETDIGRTDLFYRMRRRDFIKREFSGLRDAFNHAAGLQQFFYLGAPEHYLTAGYEFDREDPINAVGNQFAYDGHQFSGGIGWQFPRSVQSELLYAFRRERYARQSSGRRDEEHDLIFTVSKPVTDQISVTVGYFGNFNNSNNATFAYDRNVASVSLAVGY